MTQPKIAVPPRGSESSSPPRASGLTPSWRYVAVVCAAWSALTAASGCEGRREVLTTRPPGDTDDVMTVDAEGNVILHVPYRDEYPGAGSATVGRHCVARINAYRARIGLDPYQRNEDGEACAAREARDAVLADVAHVLDCPGARSQSAGGGWGHPVRSALSPELDYREGPSGGHYQGMHRPVPRSVSCGYYRSSTLETDEARDKILYDYYNDQDAILGLAQPGPALAPQGSLRAVAVAAGGLHTCAVLEDGSVRCWGARDWGQLGDGDFAPRVGEVVDGVDAPSTAVPLAGPATAVAAGYLHSCALLSTGEVQCWGAGFNGQMGNGVLKSGTTPPAAATPGRWDSTAWQGVVEDERSLFTEPEYVLLQDGSRLTGATRIEAGHSVTCADRGNTGGVCWGWLERPVRGQHFPGADAPDWVGPSSVNDYPGIDVGYAAPIRGLEAAVELSPGGMHTCGRFADGQVRCVGREIHAQAGDGVNGGESVDAGAWWQKADQYAPQSAVGLTNATQVSAGGSHTCVLAGNTTVRCWGNNSMGQAGTANAGEAALTEPQTLTLDFAPVYVAAAGAHTCAIDDGGGVHCWGSPYYGQLGSGGTLPTAPGTPVQVSGLGDVVAISSGFTHSCALTSAGRVLCWGYNEYGQLGAGDTLHRSTPVAPVGF
ncbi:MAG: hypothetical protein H6726_12945 [Sandaracinaceae bacterium]|nr:hypothetical protein [Sandaracinaceae bacterium]